MGQQMNLPKVSAIILNWNGLEDTTECLQSLEKITYPNYEVIVVDNGSEGNDVQVLAAKFGDNIQIIQNDENLGCAKGFNTGIRYVMANSQADYILIMNNDVVVAPDFLDELVRVAESDDKIGMVGPKIYYYDYEGRKDVIWFAGGEIRWWSANINRSIGGNDDDLPKYQAVRNVDWLTGAVMMFKSSLIEKIGLWNPSYSFGCVDTDYCLRARKHDFRIVYVPTAKVWHKVGVSAKKANISAADPSDYYYFIKQCFPLYIYIYQLLLFPFNMLHWSSYYLIRKRDISTLRRFLSDSARFVLQRQRQSL